MLIAAAVKQPISRDKLLGYLWPDTDAERARHALNQSLYALQQALRTDALFLGTTALELNPAVISSDLADFEDAVTGGAYERAVGLYAGPFLDGVHVPEAPEFERWVTTERARLARAYAAALECLASAATARRDYQGAAKWWRQLAAYDPASAPYVMGLMQTLAAIGDRAGALRVAAVHAAVLKHELDAPPDPAVTALEAQLRSGEPVTPSSGSAVADAAVATEATRRAARRSGAQRDPEWVERAFGTRLLIERPPVLGGMTTAYAAYDRSRSLAVELHLVDPSLVSLVDEDTLAAALERARELDNPHIVPMYEYGWVADVLFYIIGRPGGTTLGQRLEQERQMPIGEALAIADGIAAALAYAHERPLAHGDLRPKHVLLVDDRVMVKSFGVAAAISASSKQQSSLTGSRFGVPAYLSPEQLVGEGTSDGRADLYSLGCILYEMLAGELPFASPNANTLIVRKLTQPPPSVRTVRESVPPELDAVLQQCLARLPSDRVRSAAALRDVLAGIRAAL
ncbi:MAG TPA: protein kinase [Gemmatimonadales bacterium]|nr:protein kinase [Gemmatimonadales bacterium]